MTDDERRAEILKMIQRHTQAATQSRETARATLIREGIYNSDGTLAPKYGGPEIRDDETLTRTEGST